MQGASNITGGIASGVGGIFTAPVKGAKSAGVGGFFKGVGKGLVGAVVKPVVGVSDAAVSVVQVSELCPSLLFFISLLHGFWPFGS